MNKTTSIKSLVTTLTLAFIATSVADGAQQESPQGRFGPPRRVQGYYKDQITPHWFADNTRFWYRNDLAGKTKEFILVDAEQGTRQPAFDHAKLAAALSKADESQYKADQLPFDAIEFADGGKVRPISPWSRRPGPAILAPTPARTGGPWLHPLRIERRGSGIRPACEDRARDEVRPPTRPTASGRPW